MERHPGKKRWSSLSSIMSALADETSTSKRVVQIKVGFMLLGRCCGIENVRVVSFYSVSNYQSKSNQGFIGLRHVGSSKLHIEPLYPWLLLDDSKPVNELPPYYKQVTESCIVVLVTKSISGTFVLKIALVKIPYST